MAATACQGVVVVVAGDGGAAYADPRPSREVTSRGCRGGSRRCREGEELRRPLQKIPHEVDEELRIRVETLQMAADDLVRQALAVKRSVAGLVHRTYPKISDALAAGASDEQEMAVAGRGSPCVGLPSAPLPRTQDCRERLR